MEKIIKLKQPEKGFRVDDNFVKDLTKRLKEKDVKEEDIEIDLLVVKSISLVLERYEVKETDKL